jgi:hypothetical protein
MKFTRGENRTSSNLIYQTMNHSALLSRAIAQSQCLLCYQDSDLSKHVSLESPHNFDLSLFIFLPSSFPPSLPPSLVSDHSQTENYPKSEDEAPAVASYSTS